MKVYESQTVNGSGPTPEDDDEEPTEVYDFSTLFDAPNYADFIKSAPNTKSRYYERRTQAMMKAGMIASLNNGNFPDAATFLKHGPGFSKAVGNLAGEDARVAKMVDMLTAPESPWVMFVMITIPMVAQLARNHQSEMAQAGATFRERREIRKQERKAGVGKPKTPPIKVRLFKREITIPIRVRLKMPKLRNLLNSFLAPTQHPGQIAEEVFSDPAVRRSLHKMGIYVRDEQAQPPAA